MFLLIVAVDGTDLHPLLAQLRLLHYQVVRLKDQIDSSINERIEPPCLAITEINLGKCTNSDESPCHSDIRMTMDEVASECVTHWDEKTAVIGFTSQAQISRLMKRPSCALVVFDSTLLERVIAPEFEPPWGLWNVSDVTYDTIHEAILKEHQFMIKFDIAKLKPDIRLNYRSKIMEQLEQYPFVISGASKRPSSDEVFMKHADLAADRTNCTKRGVGAVIVSPEGKIVSTGYNGTPSGVKNCNEGGCDRCNSGNFSQGQGLELCKCLHAEINAIINKTTLSLDGCSMYCTSAPCTPCANAIIQSKIKKLYFSQEYTIEKLDVVSYLKNAGVECFQMMMKK